ncbi:MAG: efflux RND transporter periplasmic adaptor subunit [Gemmatimonadaceae bacterium]|nr:efflux RND transporter periplasmic adaptor subunit [Gemmatimonadaceae bacterium]
MTMPTNESAMSASLARRWRLWIITGLLTAGAITVFVLGRRHSTTSTAVSSTPSSGHDMGGMQTGAAPSSDGNAIQITASQIRQFGITFGTVERRTLESTVRTVGTVTVDEARRSQVVLKIGGYVERLYVDQTGQRVRRAQPMLDVYSPELVAAEQELLVAGNFARSVRGSSVPGAPGASIDLVAAARRRLELWDISGAQIEDILRTGKARRSLTLHAPASGVVLQKNVVQGQAIQPGQMLYDIADLSEVWVDVALREADVGAVRVGSTASVQFAGYPGAPLAGRVAYVYPTLDSASRSMRARIEVPNRSGRLMPGMYATVALTTPSRTALTVPSSAVLRTGDRALVFVDKGGGRLEPQAVQLGRETGDFTEVVDGLTTGQRVVTSAQFLLDSESNLGEVMRGMIGQRGTSDIPNAQDMQSMPGMTAPAPGESGMNDRGARVKGPSVRDTTMKGMPMSPNRR